MCLARAVLTGFALASPVVAGFAQGFRQTGPGKAISKPAAPPFSWEHAKAAPPLAMFESGKPDIFKRIKDLREVLKKRELARNKAEAAAKTSDKPSEQIKKVKPTPSAKPSSKPSNAPPTFAQRMEALRKNQKAQQTAPKQPAKTQPAKAVARPHPKSMSRLAMTDRDLDESHKDFKYIAECIELIQRNPSKMGTAQWTDYLETLNVIERDLPRLKALYAKHYGAAEKREGGKAKNIADDWLSKLHAQKALMMALSRGIDLPSNSPLMAIARALYEKGIRARDAIWEFTNYSPVAVKVMSKDTDFKLRLKALEKLCKGEDYMKELQKWR